MSQRTRLIFTGHVNAGKSSIAGHLLLKLGAVTMDAFREAERAAKANKMDSWVYAYLLDDSQDERARGITQEYAEIDFQVNDRDFTLIDTPGHHRLIQQMISGSNDVDIAVFVVSCRRGEFEKSLADTEHLAIVKCIGVSHLIVAFNKFDVLPSDQSLDVMKDQVAQLLKSFGFKHYTFCNMSGLLGYNLTESWSAYDTPCLTELLWSIPPVVHTSMESFTTDKLILIGPVIGSKMLVQGYEVILHCGNVTCPAIIDKIAGKPFARPGEKSCKLKVKLSKVDTFTHDRVILRDGDVTLFLGRVEK